MASVTFDRITKRYDDFTAVNNLNISVEDQEFLVFVGPSGCGKTTSLRMLAGLETISEGNILINGQRVNEIPSKDRDIAMVFQSYALYPHMSVYENMAFSLQLQRVPKLEIDQRVKAAAKQMGIETLLDRKPKQLSGGQRQRVAVCRAIVRNPAVFLMDEPLSNLDAKLRVQARAEIGKLHQQLGTTFIYVTHDQVEAMTMGTRIAVMNQGILQQIDTPQTLYHYPNNIFVAGFMGSPAMNFFNATLIEQDDQLWIKTDAFQLPIPQGRQHPYQAYKNKPIIFGLRPENIHDPDYAPPGIQPATVKATITVVEMMGNELILYLSTINNQEFIARVDPRSRLTVGETVNIIFNMEAFHIFDQDSEQAIR